MDIRLLRRETAANRPCAIVVMGWLWLLLLLLQEHPRKKKTKKPGEESGLPSSSSSSNVRPFELCTGVVSTYLAAAAAVSRYLSFLLCSPRPPLLTLLLGFRDGSSIIFSSIWRRGGSRGRHCSC